MIIVREKNDRLYLEFHEPKITGDHTISMDTVITHEIDISAYLEKAVQTVLDRRDSIEATKEFELSKKGFGNVY